MPIKRKNKERKTEIKERENNMGIYYVLAMVVFAAAFVLTALHIDDKKKERMTSVQD